MGHSTVDTGRTVQETNIVLMMCWQHWCIVPQCYYTIILSRLLSHSVPRPHQAKIHRPDSDLMHATNRYNARLRKNLGMLNRSKVSHCEIRRAKGQVQQQINVLSHPFTVFLDLWLANSSAIISQMQDRCRSFSRRPQNVPSLKLVKAKMRLINSLGSYYWGRFYR